MFSGVPIHMSGIAMARQNLNPKPSFSTGRQSVCNPVLSLTVAIKVFGFLSCSSLLGSITQTEESTSKLGAVTPTELNAKT